jgi:hypothetical protein
MLQRSISELAAGAAPARGRSAPDIHNNAIVLAMQLMKL